MFAHACNIGNLTRYGYQFLSQIIQLYLYLIRGTDSFLCNFEIFFIKFNANKFSF